MRVARVPGRCPPNESEGARPRPAPCSARTVTQRRPLRIALALFASAAYLFALAYPRAS